MSKGIIAGSASEKLAGSISNLSGIPIVEKTSYRFPDGNFYAKFSKVLPDEAYIVQSTYRDEHWMELFLLADEARRYGARKVSAVVPYFGYARQDHPEDGEVKSVETIFKMLKGIGVDELISVDVHFFRQAGATEINGITVRNLNALGSILNYVEEELGLDEYVLMAPDKDVEGVINHGGVCLQKERIDARIVRTKPPEIDLKDKDIVWYDDMISGGGTMLNGIEVCNSLSPRSHIVTTTHPLMLPPESTKLFDVARYVVGTDTVPFRDRFSGEIKVHEVSVAGLIAEEIKK